MVLTYHGLVEHDPPAARRPLFKIFVTAAAFREQMQLLRSRHCVVPLDRLVDHLSAGAPPPDRLAAVTFDDGWRSTRRLAAPILRELALPATVFLATGLVDSGARGLWTQRLWNALLHAGEGPGPDGAAVRRIVDSLKRMPAGARDAALAALHARHGEGPPLGAAHEFLSWREARELADFGVACGAHTVDHEILARLPLAEAERQVAESKDAVERETGEPCRLFAYPNGGAGDFGPEHASLVARHRFAAAVTQIPGRNAAGADPFRLRRIDVGLDHSRDAFLAALDGLRHWR